MQESDDIMKVLTEIRDCQREYLEEHKKVTQRSLELQQQAVSRQEQLGKTYRVALIVSAVLIIGIVAVLMYVMSYLPPRYR